jgi:hypothetical protein
VPLIAGNHSARNSSDDDGPDWLDPDEERRLAEVCDQHGFAVEEIEA